MSPAWLLLLIPAAAFGVVWTVWFIVWDSYRRANR